ncbi:MAG: hypothetical protein ACRCVT_06755, partial [Leadbetterella sp.]
MKNRVLLLHLFLLFCGSFEVFSKPKDPIFPINPKIDSILSLGLTPVNPAPSDHIFYTYDNIKKGWHKKTWLSPLKPLNDKLTTIGGFDPVQFNVQVNADSVVIGKEFEIEIIASYLDVHGMTVFQFEGMNEFSFKLIGPDGFIPISYSNDDIFRGKLDKVNNRISFKFKGKFENYSQEAFKLIRSDYNATNESVFVLKKEFFVNKNGLFYERLRFIHPHKNIFIDTIDSKRQNQKSKKGRLTSTNSSCDYLIPGYRDWCGPGDSFTIDVAPACRGDIQWSLISDGVVFSTNSSITVDSLKNYRLYCLTDNATCGHFAIQLYIYINKLDIPHNVEIYSGTDTLCGNQKTFIYIDNCGNDNSLEWITTEPLNYYNVGIGTYTVKCGNYCGYSPQKSVTIFPCTPTKPTIEASTSELCSTSDSATLTSSNCNGEIEWSNGKKGTTTKVGPGTYTSVCKALGGDSPSSTPLAITACTPITPTIEASTLELCSIGDSS